MSLKDVLGPRCDAIHFSGHVYHANYLRFLERGRSNYLRLLGANHRALFEETAKKAPGFAFVVRST
jgi:acyl-CoA thioester hydrolase